LACGIPPEFGARREFRACRFGGLGRHGRPACAADARSVVPVGHVGPLSIWQNCPVVVASVVAIRHHVLLHLDQICRSPPSAQLSRLAIEGTSSPRSAAMRGPPQLSRFDTSTTSSPVGPAAAPPVSCPGSTPRTSSHSPQPHPVRLSCPRRPSPPLRSPCPAASPPPLSARAALRTPPPRSPAAPRPPQLPRFDTSPTSSPVGPAAAHHLSCPGSTPRTSSHPPQPHPVRL